MQELAKEQGRQSLSASGTHPAASQPEPGQADEGPTTTAGKAAAASEATQKGEQGEARSEPLSVRGAPEESAQAAEMHQASSQGYTQEGCIPGPRRKLLSVEQSSEAQQSSPDRDQQQTRGSEQAGPQPSAFSRAGETDAGAKTQRPRQRAAGPDSAKSFAPAAPPSEAPGSSRQGSDPSIPQSRCPLRPYQHSLEN